MLVELEIIGNHVNLKNNKGISGRRMYDMPKLRRYKYDAALQIRPSDIGKLPDKTPVRLTIFAYFESARPDLILDTIEDVLETVGVYDNDRSIVEKHYFKRRDKKNPRLVIRVEGLPGAISDYLDS